MAEAIKARVVQPKYQYENVDTKAIDPDRLDFGTSCQDATQIAQMFERGAHATATEAAVFATLSRSLQNNKRLASTTADALTSYLQSPQEKASKALQQSQSFASQQNQSTSSPTDNTLQAFSIENQHQSTFQNSFGEKMLELARDCIPCGLRLMAFLELHPNIDLLAYLETHLKAQLKLLADIAGIFTDYSTYADFCSLLNLFSFMCIPDLQRIIATLMALLMLEVPTLDGLIGMLQALILPIFAPILMAITQLLDQFVMLVTSPLACVIDAINLQLRKLNFDVPPAGVSVRVDPNITNGILQLRNAITEGKLRIEEKLHFYISQVKAMLGETGFNDSAYVEATLRKLRIVRMIAFIVAIIEAMAKGHAVCSSGKSPETNEIDNFFHTFLNPNAPFSLWIDADGQLHIDEKLDVLPSNENVLNFEGEPFLNSQIKEVATKLANPVRSVIPCKLEIQTSDIDKVNSWITELNKV